MVRLGVVLAFLVGTSLSSTGCVRYIPVELDAVPPGEEVRVRFTDEGALRAARQLGGIRTQLDVGVAPRTPDSMAVIVWLGKDYPGTQFENVRETVVLPRSEVKDLSLRRLSYSRSALAFAGATAMFALLVDRIFFQGDRNAPPSDDNERPPPAGLNLIRIPIGRTP